MSQSFDFASNYTHTQLNGSDCSAIYLNGTRIWERYTAQRQVWVSSGYYQTSLVHIGTYYTYGTNYYVTNTDSWNHFAYHYSIPGMPSGNVHNNTASFSPHTYWVGDFRLTRGAQKGSSRTGKYRWYQLIVHQNQTNWVDTSSYQTENYTAYYY